MARATLAAVGAVLALGLPPGLARAAPAAPAPIYFAGPSVPPYAAARPLGEAAKMPLELLDAAPASAEGEMGRGEVIAVHRLRALDARVLTAPVQVGKRAVPAETVLAKVITRGGAGVDLWCDLDAPKPKNPLLDCFADTKGAGSFDQRWVAQSASRFLGVIPAAARTPTAIAPVPYRAASVEERPTGLVGYQWCDGDGVATPPRFALAVARSAAGPWSTGGVPGCAFGAWSDQTDHARVSLGGPTLALEAGEGRLRYRYEGAIGPVGPLAELMPGHPVRLAGSPEPAPVAAKAGKPRALAPTGGAPSATGGVLAKGQVFLTVPVRHGLTGALRNAVRGHGWLAGGDALAVGQPVYGIPVAGAPDGVVWCAPRAERGQWRAVCLPYTGQSYVWIKARPALMTLDLAWSGGRQASPPSVEPGPADLPVMDLTYAFGGWTKEGALLVEVQVDWGEGAQTLRTIPVAPGAGGAAVLRVMGGEIHVSRAEDAKQAKVEIVTPPRADGDLVY